MTGTTGTSRQAGRGARRSEFAHTLLAATRTRRGMIGLTLTGIVCGLAAIGPWLAPHTPTEFLAATFAQPGGDLLLGSDALGRDVLSRVLAGGWVLLLSAAAATALGIVVGTTAGIIAAYFGGWRDSVVMRLADVVLAFPQIVFALLLISVVGPNTALLVAAVGLSHAPQVARVVRGTAMDIVERDFVKAVQITGVRPSRVMQREILPNLTSPLMVEIGLRMAYSIVIIAGLSFIGFGLQPPTPNWGTMINENRIGLTQNLWATVVPSLLLATLCVGLNTFTDAIARVALGTDRADRLHTTDVHTTVEVHQP